jgi:hypothetical protein
MSATATAGGRRSRIREFVPERLMTRERATWHELIIAGAVIALAAFLLLSQHIIKGGFYTDDYAYQNDWLLNSRHGFWHGFSAFLHSSPLKGRPTLSLYLSVVNETLGAHQGWYLAWAGVLAVLFSWSIYLLLRALRLRPIEAGLIALLVLVFPWSDSTRAWSIISDANLAMSLVLLGFCASLRSLSTPGRRAVAWRVGGLVLVVLGLTTYELTFVVMLIAFPLYRTRAGWRRVLREGAIDWVVLILVYVLITSHSTAQRLSTSQTLSHGRTIAGQAITLLTTHALPFGSTAAGLVVCGLIVAAAIAMLRLLPAGDPTRGTLRRWLMILGIAILMMAAAYVIYAPAALDYLPLSPGLSNRTNAFGALPIVVIVYTLAALVGVMVFRGVRGAPRWAMLATSAMIVALGIGYTVSIAANLKIWDSAHGRAESTLVAFIRAVPELPHHALVVFFGQPVWETANIPVWAASWDLDGAIGIAYHDQTLTASPAFPGTEVLCYPRKARLIDPAVPGAVLPIDIVPYGKLYLFNTINGAVERPLSQSQCKTEAPTFVPGPWLATDPGADDPGL